MDPQSISGGNMPLFNVSQPEQQNKKDPLPTTAEDKLAFVTKYINDQESDYKVAQFLGKSLESVKPKENKLRSVLEKEVDDLFQKALDTPRYKNDKEIESLEGKVNKTADDWETLALDYECSKWAGSNDPNIENRIAWANNEKDIAELEKMENKSPRDQEILSVKYQLRDGYRSLDVNIEKLMKREEIFNEIKELENKRKSKTVDEWKTLVLKYEISKLLDLNIEGVDRKIEFADNQSKIKPQKSSVDGGSDNLDENIKKPSQKLLEINKKIEETKLHNAVSNFYNVVFNSENELHPELKGANREVLLEEANRLERFANSSEAKLKAEEKAHLLKSAEKLKNAFWYLQNFQNKELSSNKIIQKIKGLKDGESLLIQGSSKDHAFLYEITKKNDLYEFTIINTGSGVKSKKETDQERLIKNINYDGVGLVNRVSLVTDRSYKGYEQIFSEKFISLIMSEECETKESLGLMNEIHSHLSGKATEVEGRKHHLQTRGNCLNKSQASWMYGDLIDNFGKERGRKIHNRLKIFRAQELKTEVDKIDEEILKKIYKVKDNEELHREIKKRDMAFDKVIVKWKEKT